MAEVRGNVGIGEKDGYIVTSFVPPLPKNKLFEATTSALSIFRVAYDDEDRIKGVIYEAGDPAELSGKLDKLRQEVSSATKYEVSEEVRKLGETASSPNVDFVEFATH